MRKALSSLQRFIGTTETAKHRTFIFIDANVLPDQKIRVIASDDAYLLGVLSSRVHVTWALAAGGTLEDRPVYNNTRCFGPFPFPAATPDQKAAIRSIGEDIDTHRKRQQALYPDLTVTQMYNVLEALREGRELSTSERKINDKGLVSLLKDTHARLDVAVLEAYGWDVTLSADDILSNLVELNLARAEEEKNGKIKWLRPEYQCADQEVEQASLGVTVKKGRKTKIKKAKVKPTPWPKSLPEQFQAVRSALARMGGSGDMEEVAKCYKQAPRARVQEVLDTLVAQGFIYAGEGDDYCLN
ncbi:MAG: hypothetical protein JEY79_00685 [Pseudodesulfovibrio sp.]|nr:hypothetical protein [Pseudodesulfovibrio sp.]